MEMNWGLGGVMGAQGRHLGCQGPGRVPRGRPQERAPDGGFHHISRSLPGSKDIPSRPRKQEHVFLARRCPAPPS